MGGSNDRQINKKTGEVTRRKGLTVRMYRKTEQRATYIEIENQSIVKMCGWMEDTNMNERWTCVRNLQLFLFLPRQPVGNKTSMFPS